MEGKTQQIQMISLDDLVEREHPYRKFNNLINFQSLCRDWNKVSNFLKEQKGMERQELFKVLLLQFLENLHDRELERYLKENNSAKWFCDFSLFIKFRKRVGISRLSSLFARVREELKTQGYINEVFNFVDATHLISKAKLWEERASDSVG